MGMDTSPTTPAPAMSDAEWHAIPEAHKRTSAAGLRFVSATWLTTGGRAADDAAALRSVDPARVAPVWIADDAGEHRLYRGDDLTVTVYANCDGWATTLTPPARTWPRLHQAKAAAEYAANVPAHRRPIALGTR